MNNPKNSQSKKNRNYINGTKRVVEIKAVTWNKDSHGLFDYENSYYDMRKFQIVHSVVLFRNNHEIDYHKKNDPNLQQIQNNNEFLLSITKDSQQNNSQYHIDVPGEFPDQHTAPNPTYLIVRSLKQKDGRNQRGYTLQSGNVIKLGRIEYKVVQIQSDYGTTLTNGINNNFMIKQEPIFDVDNQEVKKSEMELEDEDTCKYCYLDHISDIEYENARLYPCICKTFVHFICLQKWIQNKIIAKNNVNIATYQWTKLKCEICLKDLPRTIKFKQQNYDLITIEKPNCPFIILEKIQDENQSPTISIIVPERDQVLKLGRGHQCDLRISDISVSRIHAHLKFEEGQFKIYDNDSKFGTLILLTNPYQVKSDKAAVQIGRTVFTFVIKNLNLDNADAREN